MFHWRMPQHIDADEAISYNIIDISARPFNINTDDLPKCTINI